MTQYSDFIPYYNRKPKFSALINALTAAYTQLQNAALQIPSLYDINNAQGAQLDVLGQWIGLPRTLFVSSNQWFSYDIIDQGWNMALWTLALPLPVSSLPSFPMILGPTFPPYFLPASGEEPQGQGARVCPHFSSSSSLASGSSSDLSSSLWASGVGGRRGRISA